MRDLTAHVTSSLLKFPEVTRKALGEDELTLDCVLHGKFTGGRSGLACLAYGPQLEVVNAVSGERLSAYRFSGLNEQPPTILAVKEFSWQRRTGLLIGLEETEGSVLCLYDLGISRVVKAVVLPGRVTAIEPIINHGGASLTTQHLHQSLRWLFGVAAVVTDVGHVLLIDLCLDDLSCSQNEIEASDLEVITGILPEIPKIREAVTRKGRHLCFQLLSPSGTAVTALAYVHRSNQLVVGFSDGYLSLWNMKSLKKEYCSQLEGGRIPVYAVTFQEPENDPRNCCYLWAVQSTQESEGDIVSLHLLQLAFSDRQRLASGQVMYEGLEYCEERYSLDLTGGVFSLRGQTSNTKLIGCQTVEKFRSHVDREDSINEIVSPDTSVSVFSWQIKTYGQGKPNTYLGIFDINRWYHAQMPDSLRSGEFLHNCSYFALWSLDAVVNMTSPHRILDVLIHERSFSRGVPPSCPPPEQFFNPSTYSFDATCLLNSGVVHMACTEFQKDTLQFLKKPACSFNEAIPDGYNRCLIAGLLSPRFFDVQPSNLSHEEQFEAVLLAAVQTSSLGLLISCIKQWSAEEHPDSSPNLRFVLEWTWNKVVNTKQDFVRLCIPLFDGSSNFIDPQTLQSLQHCELLLNNLSTVLNCFVMETQELTEQGFTDLTNKQVVTSLLLQYVQVVIWFCRSSLLPESLDEDLQLSKPFYNYQHIQRYYASCRQKLERLSRGKWNPDCLMIDGLISQLGDSVVKLWQRDDGGTGKYPPPSLHALLDLYLSENIEELYKHATIIYLLLDVMHSCPNRTDTSVDSFPTAFAVPVGLVNLIQGFWCLDHNDFENSLAYLFHPATIKLPWQHMRIIQSLMCQGEHKRALRYIQTMKPSMLSDSEVALHLTVLLFNSCMVEAWSVLRQHSTRLNVEEMLRHVYETCQELGLMEDLLKLPFTETEQECLEKFLQTSAGVNNHEFLLIHHLQRANYIPALQLNQSLKNNLMHDRDPHWRERSVVRNAILDQYGKILPRVQRKLAVERAKPYPVPSSLRREILRPKPLSTVAKQVAPGNVVTKSTFINNVLSKIGEVWEETEQKNKAFQNEITEDRSSNAVSNDRELPNPFVGTPVIKSLQKCSRLLDLVVQPISLDSLPFRSSLQASPTASTSSMLSSPLHSNPRCSIRTLLHKKAPELTLLETPRVVKRAKALTATSPCGFPAFARQSILRSSLRTTPLATPTASPGRSVTPPLRAKETKISFMEENKASQWTAEIADHKTKHTAVSSEHNINPQMEDIWTKNRKIAFISVRSLQQDNEEVEVSSQSIPDKHLDTTETSKEINDTCVDSSETITEDHDAKSPVDLGNDTFVASQSPHCFSEELVNMPRSSVRENSEIVRRDLLQIEHQTSAEREQSAGEQETELPEKEDREYSLPPEDRVVEMDDLNAFVPLNESESNAVESSAPTLLDDRLLPEPSIQVLEPVGADGESVISIPDSEEDIVSIHSKNEFEDANRAVETVREESVLVLEEVVPDTQLEMQELNLVADGKHKEQIAEVIVEEFPYSKLNPSSSHRLEYSCATIEGRATCELLDKETDESSFVEGDEGEIIVPHNNFSLILEEDKEPEIGEATVWQTPFNPTAPNPETVSLNVAGNNNEELNTNSVSTVTSSEITENTAKVLPYVPEPVQMAIAENLLDVVKDTRNKEVSAEVAEQSFPESKNKKVLSFPQGALENAVEMNKDTKLSQVEEHSVTFSSCTTEPATQKPDIPFSDDQSLPKMDKAEIVMQSTLRRSARRIKETLDVSEGLPANSDNKPQDQQALQSLTFEVNDDKKTDISANVSPVAEEFQATITPRRRVKNVKKLASELPVHPSEQPTVRRRTPRVTRSLIGEQEGSQFVIDHKIQMTVNPKSARKLKTMAFQLAEDVISDPEVESHKEQVTAKPRRGKTRNHCRQAATKAETETMAGKVSLLTPGRRINSRKSSLPKPIMEDDIQPAEPETLLPAKQERPQSTNVPESVPDQGTEVVEQSTVRRKRGRPRKISLDVSASERLDLSVSSPPPPPDTRTSVITRSRGRSKASSLPSSAGPPLEESMVHTAKKKSSKTDADETVLEGHLQADESLTSAKSPARKQGKLTRIRKKSQLPSLSEEGLEEESLQQARDHAAELQSTDTTRQRLGETGKTMPPHGTQVKRTRHHKKSINESLSLDEAFCFSPPLTKLSEKIKGEKPVTPVQLKGLDTDLASQFVFSPPVLRSRKRQISSISRIVEELELPIKEEKDAISIKPLEKPKVKRGKSAQSKTTKTSKGRGKDSSWSPPPMEIKFISPFGTPVDGSKSKPRESADKAEKTGQKTVRRKEKRLSSYPKPVVRKKML